MPKHRVNKKLPKLKSSGTKHPFAALVRLIPGKRIGKLRVASQHESKTAVHNTAKPSLLSEQNAAPEGALPAARTQNRKPFRIFQINNVRRMLIICGCLAASITAVVLFTALTGDKPQQVAAQNNLQNNLVDAIPTLSEAPTPEPTKLASISVVIPVSESIRISEGVDAPVVSQLQNRLMALGYMDTDEADNLFSQLTTEAVNHFKAQHGLTADGVVDEQTYSLLFSDAAQYYTLSVGSDDNDVYELQQRLTALGYMDAATGQFGTETEAAVMKFQKLNSLPEDGKIGKDTRELLYSPNVVANYYVLGDENEKILACQERLRKLGFLTTQPDAHFGPDTKEAIQRFQEANGMIADGFLGPETCAAILSDNAQSCALSVGSDGAQVTKVQQRLKDLGYSSRVTGYFGSDTETAVRKFQDQNGLTQDGRVGPNTMNTLLSSRAKKAPVNTGSGKAGSGKGTGSSGSGSGSGVSPSPSPSPSASPSANPNPGSGSGSGTGASSKPIPEITGANVESFIAVAESRLNCEYVLAAKGPDTFDCSGFVYWCLNQVGVRQGYLTSRGWPSCTKYTKITDLGELQRGDIIVFEGHCAIALGDGYQIDASSRNNKVVKRRITTSLNFVCGFRVF